MAANFQKMSLGSHQGLSYQVSRFCLSESTDTNPQSGESKWWKDFHALGTVLHRDPKNKKGLFGLCAAAKATSTHDDYTPVQMFTAAPTKWKCKLWECLT